MSEPAEENVEVRKKKTAARRKEIGVIEKPTKPLAGPRDFFVEKIADAVAERLAQMQGRSVRLLNTDETARYLGLSREAIYDLIRDGKLRALKATRKPQFDIYDLDNFIESLKQ